MDLSGERTNMVYVTMNRIHSTRMAGVRANNQWFKDYWFGLANHFEKELKQNYSNL